MRFNRFVLGTAAALCVGAVFTPESHAVTARFDFGGTVVQPGFDFVSNAGVGSSGPISLTVTGVGTTIAARDRVAGNGGGTEIDMWRDFIFSNGSNLPGEGLDVNLTGLTPNATYPVRVWAFDEDSNGGRAALWNGRIMAFTDGPDPTTLNDRFVDTFITTDAAGSSVLQGHALSNNQEPHHVFINGLEIGDPFVGPPPELPPKNRLEFAIDIDSTFGGTAINTAPGFTSLDATNGDAGNVLIDNTYFQVFSADGSRNRNTGDPLTTDFVFDDGEGQAVGVRVFNLPDALWDVEVWAFDTFDAGLQIIGITQTGVGETIFTNSFVSNSTTPFTFRIDSSLLEDGFGVFARENNEPSDRSRFNAIRFTQVVPEPASAMLGLIGAMALALRRRRTA